MFLLSTAVFSNLVDHDLSFLRTIMMLTLSIDQIMILMMSVATVVVRGVGSLGHLSRELM